MQQRRCRNSQRGTRHRKYGSPRRYQKNYGSNCRRQVSMATEVHSLYNIRGRGAAANPVNRFELIETVPDVETLDQDLLELGELPMPQTQLIRDATKTIIARNDSPDVGFDTSVNP